MLPDEGRDRQAGAVDNRARDNGTDEINGVADLPIGDRTGEPEWILQIQHRGPTAERNVVRRAAIVDIFGAAAADRRGARDTQGFDRQPAAIVDDCTTRDAA